MHVTDPGIGSVPGDAFSVALGRSPAITVPVADHVGPQHFDIPASNFMPNSDINNGVGPFAFVITELLYPDGNPSLTIDDICVFDRGTGTGTNTTTGSGGSGGVTGGGSSFVGAPAPGGFISSEGGAVCTAPTLTIYGDLSVINIIGVARGMLQWLWDSFATWVSCVLVPIINGIWIDLVRGIQVFIFGVQFLAASIGPFVNWIGSFITALVTVFLPSVLVDLGLRLMNAVYTILNGLGLTAFANFILNLLANLPAIIILGAQILGSLLAAVLHWIGLIISTIVSTLEVVPILFLSVINGFNTATSTLPVYAPLCSDPTSPLYGPCLIFYVTDNTLLAGPVFYLFLVIDGAIAAMSILWAIRYAGKKLSNG